MNSGLYYIIIGIAAVGTVMGGWLLMLGLAALFDGIVNAPSCKYPHK